LIMKIFLKRKKRFHKNNQGFTLVELLVVFFIMASILAVIIPGYLDYSTKLDLDNLALDVALTIREAQSYGAGVKVSNAGDFDTPFGVHFDINNPNQFIFFENTDNSDSVYKPPDGLPDDTIIDRYDIKAGYAISDLCGSKGGGSPDCNSGGVQYLDIIFKRPNPDAIITIRNNGGGMFGGNQDSGGIKLVSPDTTFKNINVVSPSSISVSNM